MSEKCCYAMMVMAQVVVAVMIWPNRSWAVTCGKIVRGQGPVEVLSLTGEQDEHGNPVRRGARLRKSHVLDCQDIVITGPRGRCVIQLTSARLTMGPNSRIAVAKYNKSNGDATVVNLTFGKVRTSYHSKETSPETTIPFRIRTQSAVAGVRGTDFYVKYEPNSGATQQATLGGKVEVVQRGTNQKVVVESGQQVDVASSQPVSGVNISEESMAEIEHESKTTAPTSPTKALEVKPIAGDLVAEIQDTSVLAKVDAEFTSSAALKILGNPKGWKEQENIIPEELRNIENKF